MIWLNDRLKTVYIVTADTIPQIYSFGIRTNESVVRTEFSVLDSQKILFSEIT